MVRYYVVLDIPDEVYADYPEAHRDAIPSEIAGWIEHAMWQPEPGRFVDVDATVYENLDAISLDRAERTGPWHPDYPKLVRTCEACHNMGWLIVACDGDRSRAWIERHDECELYDDYDDPMWGNDDALAMKAARYFSEKLGRIVNVGYAVPEHHGWDHTCDHPYLTNMGDAHTATLTLRHIAQTQNTTT